MGIKHWIVKKLRIFNIKVNRGCQIVEECEKLDAFKTY